jgi:hypothetical protein
MRRFQRDLARCVFKKTQIGGVCKPMIFGCICPLNGIKTSGFVFQNKTQHSQKTVTTKTQIG